MRAEKMKMEWKAVEQWMDTNALPPTLRKRIGRPQQYKWEKTKRLDVENFLNIIPKDLRNDIKRHLSRNLIKRVPMFETMPEQLLDIVCDHLKVALYTERSYIVREGEPVDEMLFIMRGQLQSWTTNGGRTGFFSSVNLKEDDFCGEELLAWALDPHPSVDLRISTRTIRTLSEVEAFALMADDLEFFASEFHQLGNRKNLKYTLRFYSLQWRTWAVCFIQVAWRQYKKKKLDESRRREEDRLQDALAKSSGNPPPSLGAAIYASQFSVNALRAIRHRGTGEARPVERVPLPPMILQKPAEPDFASEEE